MEDELAGSAPLQPDAFRFPSLQVEPHLARRCDWPFYLSRRQRAWLRRLRQAWGDDAVIQIYAGCVRICGQCGDWRFTDDSELRTETARRRSPSAERGRAACVHGGGALQRM